MADEIKVTVDHTRERYLIAMGIKRIDLLVKKEEIIDIACVQAGEKLGEHIVELLKPHVEDFLGKLLQRYFHRSLDNAPTQSTA